jgi:osmotically-inducible protein OsmY
MKHFNTSIAHHLFGLRPVALALLVSASLLTGCAPLVVGGVVGGSVSVAADRRTAGTQVEDQTIEVKAGTRVRDVIGERGGVSVVSYNRVVLIVGNVPTEQDKAAIEQTVAKIPSVRSTVNELTAGVSFSSNFNDAVITTKVKATFIDAKDLQVNAFKVVTDRGVVYLMGRVTDREAERATELTRGISGVKKVVRAFEIVTDAELNEMLPGRAPGNATSNP